MGSPHRKQTDRGASRVRGCLWWGGPTSQSVHLPTQRMTHNTHTPRERRRRSRRAQRPVCALRGYRAYVRERVAAGQDRMSTRTGRDASHTVGGRSSTVRARAPDVPSAERRAPRDGLPRGAHVTPHRSGHVPPRPRRGWRRRGTPHMRTACRAAMRRRRSGTVGTPAVDSPSLQGGTWT